MKNKYYILVEINNGGSSVEKIVSDRELDFVKDIIPYYEKRGLNWAKDSISLIDKPEEIVLE